MTPSKSVHRCKANGRSESDLGPFISTNIILPSFASISQLGREGNQKFIAHVKSFCITND